MIGSILLVALGFLLACLMGLMITPPLWRRAVRLTTRQLEAAMPMSVEDIQADKDHLRAEYAIELRRAEAELADARRKFARILVESNRRKSAIVKADTDVEDMRRQLGDAENANKVLERTIAQRLPGLDAKAKAAREELGQRDAELARLNEALAAHTRRMSETQGELARAHEETQRLRAALEDKGGTDSDGVLQAEASRLREDVARLSGQEAHDLKVLRRQLDSLAAMMMQGVPVKDGPAARDAPAQTEAPVPVTGVETTPQASATNGSAAPASAPEASGETDEKAATPARPAAARTSRQTDTAKQGAAKRLSERIRAAGSTKQKNELTGSE